MKLREREIDLEFVSRQYNSGHFDQGKSCKYRILWMADKPIVITGTISSRADNESANAMDGWRGVSIAAVLLCHGMPMPFRLNAGFGIVGMSMFFILSGYLIAKSLERLPSYSSFLKARARRIIPCFYMFLAISFCFGLLGWKAVVTDALFLSNIPKFFYALTPETAHIWSLCLEVHFYLLAASMYYFVGKKFPFYFSVIFFVLSVVLSLWTGTFFSIVTTARLSSCALGFFTFHFFKSEGIKKSAIPHSIERMPSILILAIFLVGNYLPDSSLSGILALIGAFLCFSRFCLLSTNNVLQSKTLKYLGAISYALYLYHHLFLTDWFRQGPLAIKIAKRILSFSASISIAHVSTYYFESRFHKIRRPVAPKKGTDSDLGLAA